MLQKPKKQKNDKGIKSSHKVKKNKPKTNEFVEDIGAGAFNELIWAGWF